MLPETGKVLVCVSGGADSMCLFNVLVKLSEKCGFTIEAAHYNHNLRGEESDRDEQFVKDYCAQRGIGAHFESGDVTRYAKDNKIGIEEAARELRYDFFKRIAEKINACRIATAHNADDNAETMIMNLARGTGTLGLSGIPPKRGMIIRPILRISRDEIMRYIRDNDVPYVEDSTNSLDIYTRNMIRHEVMPVLSKINPRFTATAATAAEFLRADEEFLLKLADAFIQEHCTDNTVPAEQLAELSTAISTRVIRLLHGGSLSAQHVKSVLQLCKNDSPSASISLPGMRVYREYDKVIFGGDLPDGFEIIELTDGLIKIIPGLQIKMTCKKVVYDDKINRINKSLTSFLFKSEAICGKIIVRPRISGDTIKLYGHNGTKSLKNLFIERRIPKEKRSLIPVVADDIGVLAVYGIGMGQRAVPNNGDLTLQINFEINAATEGW